MTADRSAGILRLFGRVRDYDWGSPTAIYDLLGEDPSGRPAAELWLGTHPGAPSETETSAGGRRQ
ncbi:type I phosphomannose isomerase catalytic subunit, partial [Protofrankia coriariae]